MRTPSVSVGFVAALLLMLCLTRPSMLGQEYNLVGGIGMVLLTIVYMLTQGRGAMVVGQRSPAAWTGVALLVFWCYCLCSAIFFGQSDIALLFMGSAAGFGVTICFLVLSLNSDLVQRTFAWFARLNALLGYSIAITTALIPLIGYATLKIGSYQIGGYEDAADSGNGDVLFPFSVVYTTMQDYGIRRFTGIYREPGLAQAYFVWAGIFLMYTRARLFWIIGAFLGAFMCAATAVVFSVAAAAVVHFGSRSLRKPKEMLLLLALLIALALLFIYTPGLGMMDKMETHGASVTDRSEGMARALPDGDVFQWLVGHGMFYKNDEGALNLGINAISSVFAIGGIGFVLYLWTYFAGAFGATSRENAWRYLTLISPLLVTALFFQPVIDAPLVLATLFFSPVAFPKTEKAISAEKLKEKQPFGEYPLGAAGKAREAPRPSNGIDRLAE